MPHFLTNKGKMKILQHSITFLMLYDLRQKKSGTFSWELYERTCLMKKKKRQNKLSELNFDPLFD